MQALGDASSRARLGRSLMAAPWLVVSAACLYACGSSADRDVGVSQPGGPASDGRGQAPRSDASLTGSPDASADSSMLSDAVPIAARDTGPPVADGPALLDATRADRVADSGCAAGTVVVDQQQLESGYGGAIADDHAQAGQSFVAGRSGILYGVEIAFNAGVASTCLSRCYWCCEVDDCSGCEPADAASSCPAHCADPTFCGGLPECEAIGPTCDTAYILENGFREYDCRLPDDTIILELYAGSPEGDGGTFLARAELSAYDVPYMTVPEPFGAEPGRGFFDFSGACLWVGAGDELYYVIHASVPERTRVEVALGCGDPYPDGVPFSHVSQECDHTFRTFVVVPDGRTD